MLLQGKKAARHDFGELIALGEHCSDREQRAEAAERELTKLKLLIYMQNRIGEEMDAVVTGVEEFGLFVEGIRIAGRGTDPMSRRWPTTAIASTARRTRFTGHRAGNSFRLGDRVRVSVARVDVDRRELDFRLVDRGPAAGGKKRGGSRTPQRPKGKPRAGQGREISIATSGISR